MNQSSMELDRDLLFDFLWTEQWLTGRYQAAVQESGTNRVRQQFLQTLSDQQQLSTDIYDELSKRGWISSVPAEFESIQSVKRTYTRKLNDL